MTSENAVGCGGNMRQPTHGNPANLQPFYGGTLRGNPLFKQRTALRAKLNSAFAICAMDKECRDPP